MSLTVVSPSSFSSLKYSADYVYFPLKYPLPGPNDPKFYTEITAYFQNAASNTPTINSFDELAFLGRTNLDNRLKLWQDILISLERRIESYHQPITGLDDQRYQALQEYHRFAILAIETLTKAQTNNEAKPLIANWRDPNHYLQHKNASVFLITRLTDPAYDDDLPATYPYLAVRCHASYIDNHRINIRCEPRFVRHDPNPHSSILSSTTSPFLLTYTDFHYLKNHADYRHFWLSYLKESNAKILETVFARGITI